MKKLILLLFILVIFSGASAEQISYDIPVCVTVNGKYINFENKPMLMNGTTYLPARFFCEAFAAEVEWIPLTQTVIINHYGNEIFFDIGDETAYLNGEPVNIGGSARLINGVTYLPVRFTAESLGGRVLWNENYYTVEISMDNVTLPENVTGGRSYSNDEIYWLAKIISSESEDEPMKGKIAVGNVVLNRVESDEYPDTIYSVIFDKKFGVQFQPVANGSIYKDAVKDAYLAAKLCLEGHNVIGSCKYFLNPDKATNFWIPDNKQYYTTIGSHDFYY